jgi:hypothetical protein
MVSFVWYKKQVPLWLERFIIPICAAIVVGAVILNPLKFDWQQRLSLFFAIAAFAYFLAHTIHKPKDVAAAESEQRIGFLEDQVKSLQSQAAAQQAETVKEKQRRQAIRDQLAVFLGEGKKIQESIPYRSPQSITEKEDWERRVLDYLTKNLDKSYVSRFQNPTNPGSISTPVAMTPKTIGLWLEIGAKMATLNDFMSELRD